MLSFNNKINNNVNIQPDQDYDAYLQQAYEEQAENYGKHPQRIKQGQRECRIKSRGNGAQNDKDSILVEAKNLLKTLHFLAPDITTLQRREGAYHEMKQAALNLIRLFCKARSNPELRQMYIDDMIGEMGVIDAMFDECIQLGALTDKMKLKIARHMDRMDEGIKRWRNATDRRQSNFRSQAGGRSAQV